MTDQTLLTIVVTLCIIAGLAAVGWGALLLAAPVPQPPHYD